MSSLTRTRQSTEHLSDECNRLRDWIEDSDAIVVGAGAGLSTAAGFTYSGRRFEEEFGDFIAKYGITDMYSASFREYDSPEETWAFWSRMIMLNRYKGKENGTYRMLLDLLRDRDYFVITTNVDHCFQRFGFDKERLFYTQGDYGLWQCSEPCCDRTWDNEAVVRRLYAEQRNMRVPSELVPRCPNCGRPMVMNLRADQSFVEDEGWHIAAGRYRDFLGRVQGRSTLYLELGVGYNTPSIIKYPFWQMTYSNPRARYACVNMGQAYAPAEIRSRSLCIDGDIRQVLESMV